MVPVSQLELLHDQAAQAEAAWEQCNNKPFPAWRDCSKEWWNCAFQFQVLTRSCSTEQKACEEVNKQIDLQRQSFKPCVGAAVPCREANTNYDQHDLNLGFLNKQDNADLCAQSCRDHAKKNPSAPCKFWTWIGPDADQPYLTLRNCWLKNPAAREGRFSQVGVISGGAAC